MGLSFPPASQSWPLGPDLLNSPPGLWEPRIENSSSQFSCGGGFSVCAGLRPLCTSPDRLGQACPRGAATSSLCTFLLTIDSVSFIREHLANSRDVGGLTCTCQLLRLSSPAFCSELVVPLGSRFSSAALSLLCIQEFGERHGLRFLFRTCRKSHPCSLILSRSASVFSLPLDRPGVCAGVIYCHVVIFLAVVELHEI